MTKKFCDRCGVETGQYLIYAPAQYPVGSGGKPVMRDVCKDCEIAARENFDKFMTTWAGKSKGKAVQRAI